MAELQTLGLIECQNPEPDPARYVILPGLELAKAKKKVVLDIHTWICCFAIYLTVMATKQPTILPELVAYMLFIIRIQREYEELVWRFYDEAFRDKAAATGNKKMVNVRPGPMQSPTYRKGMVFADVHKLQPHWPCDKCLPSSSQYSRKAIWSGQVP